MLRLLFVMILCAAIVSTHAQTDQPRASVAAPEPPSVAAMSAAYGEGRLPRPLPLPVGTQDEVVPVLARTIAERGPDGSPALVTALLAAGFGIRGLQGVDDQSVTQMLRPGQGIVLDAWEVALIAKAFGSGQSNPLSLAAKALTALPGFQRVPLVPAIIASLRVSAESRSPHKRFLARLIIELGRYNPRPYDLLDEHIDPASVRLDPIQLTLILIRLAADGPAPMRRMAERPVAVPPFLRPVALRRAALLMGPSSPPAGPAPSQPCSLTDLQSAITDWGATAESAIFSYVWQLVAEEAGRGVETVAAALPVMGALITVAKLYLTIHALEVDITMAPSPLERSRTMGDGKSAWLNAKVRADTGRWQNVNCARFMLNLIGADADVPQDGVLSGVGVFWRVLDGPVMFGTHTPDQPGRIVAPNRHVTDENGNSRILVIGRRQATDLTRMKVRAIERSFTIGVDVQLKGAKPSEDFRDLVGSVLPHLIAGEADPLGLLADGVAETAFRSFQPAGGRVFPLTDWQLCDGWHGDVSYTTVRSEDTRTDGRFGSFEDRRQRLTTTSTTEITGTLLDSAVQNTEAIVLQGTAHAQITLQDDRRGVEYRLGPRNEPVLCGRSTANTSGSGAGDRADAKVRLSLDSDGSYRLEFNPLEARPDAVARGTSYRAPGCGSGFEPLTNSYFKRLNPSGPGPASWAPPQSVTGRIGADRDTIQGKVERPGFGPGGTAEIRITWNLTRSCSASSGR